MLAQMFSGSVDVVGAHNVLSVKHWDRMGRGMLYAGSSSVPWAILHARTFQHDVLACGQCAIAGRFHLAVATSSWRIATPDACTDHSPDCTTVSKKMQWRSPPHQAAKALI